MERLGKCIYEALLVVVIIMVGAAEATEVKEATPSPTMEAISAWMVRLPSPFTPLITSFIPFLARRLYRDLSSLVFCYDQV